MPLELSVWRIDSGLQRLETLGMSVEARLEDMLAQDMSIASPDWMVVGRQVPTPWGKFIDLLCIDRDGGMVVLELKRDKTEREIIAQMLDYGSFVQTIEADALRRIFAAYQKDYAPAVPSRTVEEAFREQFGGLSPPEELCTSHELVIVASTLDSATERIVSYLADEYGVRINAVFFRVFRDEDREYLARAWLRDDDAADGIVPASPAEREHVPFNGEYYVNFGEGPYRHWEDARRFGFVSAGHGPKFRDAIQRLKCGDRIWVNVPRRKDHVGGFVGVGIVEEPAVPVRDFLVKTGAGATVPLLEAGVFDGMKLHADDPERSEYLARVRWTKAVPLAQAVREPGLFGNQNCVAEPRVAKWPYTIERLKQHFGVRE